MEIKHYPRLDTILRVESLLIDQNKALSINEIMDKLPKKIMRSTLHTILKYLIRSKKIRIVNGRYKWVFGQHHLNKDQLEPQIENHQDHKEEDSENKIPPETNRIEKLVKELEQSTLELEKLQKQFKTYSN